MNCELCGLKPAIYKSEIEGTVMNTCQECSRFGKNKGASNVRVVVVDKKKNEIRDPEYIFIQGYGRIVKNAREKLGLKPEDFAKKISEKESLLHQIESEHIKPSVVLAHKLEHALKIHIIEEVKGDEKVSTDHTKAASLTLGDFIKKK